MFKKIKYLCILLILTSLFATAPSVTLYADTSPKEAVSDAASSVLQIILSYTDDAGNMYYVHQGSGILIGKSSDIQYIITDQQIVTASSDELAQIRKWNGLASDANLTPQIQILLEPDILVTASIASKGNQLPYTLLTPDTPLQSISSIPISSLTSAAKDQTAYLCGYATDMSILGETEISSAKLSYLSGTITNVDTKADAIDCDIETATGCSGAPLCDESGNLLAMAYFSGNNLELLSADAICNILDSLNVVYTTTDSNTDYNVADDATKQELRTLLSECQSDVTKNADSYSKKSLTNYKTAISTAMNVLSSDTSTKDDYQDSIDELTKARKKLKPYNHTFHIIELILLAIIVVFIAINLKQFLKAKRFERSLHPTAMDTPAAASAKSMAALIRSDTKEVIWIDKEQIRIGKDVRQVDYCIEDNSSISRYHAAVVCQNNQYYLIDNDSTNHTFKNHSMIAPQSAVLLEDGDSIAFANVPFQFRIMES